MHTVAHVCLYVHTHMHTHKTNEQLNERVKLPTVNTSIIPVLGGRGRKIRRIRDSDQLGESIYWDLKERGKGGKEGGRQERKIKRKSLKIYLRERGPGKMWGETERVMKVSIIKIYYTRAWQFHHETHNYVKSSISIIQKRMGYFNIFVIKGDIELDTVGPHL